MFSRKVAGSQNHEARRWASGRVLSRDAGVKSVAGKVPGSSDAEVDGSMGAW